MPGTFAFGEIKVKPGHDGAISHRKSFDQFVCLTLRYSLILHGYIGVLTLGSSKLLFHRNFREIMRKWQHYVAKLMVT